MGPDIGCGKPDCRLADMVHLLGDPYHLAILYEFGHAQGPTLRFNQIQDALDVSPTTLSNRLKELVDHGLLSRRAYDENPPRVEYTAHQHLGELDDIFQQLHQWADSFLRPRSHEPSS